LAHKFSDSLQFTIDKLSSSNNTVVYLHIDLKSDISSFIHLQKNNVKIIETRIDIKWGDISMIDATIEILRCSRVDGYCTLLSGDDFPCKSTDEINNFLESLGGDSLMHFQDSRNSFIDPYNRFNYQYPWCFFKKNKSFIDKVFCKLYKVFPLINNSYGKNYLIKNNIQLFKGTQWFSLSSSSVSKIIDFLDKEPNYYRSFKKTFCPDEMFFHTLVRYLSLPTYHSLSEVNDCLRYLDWESGPEYPKILGLSDIPSIKKSNCLFARKASSNMDFSEYERMMEI